MTAKPAAKLKNSALAIENYLVRVGSDAADPDRLASRSYSTIRP
jgi:hypothetical protein